MGGEATVLGPFTGGLHNSAGNGEFIENEELYELTNMEVDSDGSLANRPQINNYSVTGVTNIPNSSLLGTYLPPDGRKFLVIQDNVANVCHLVNAVTGVSAFNTPIKAVCCIQYADRLWVVATTGSTQNGGYFAAPTSTTLSWTTVATMPKGDAVAMYRDRLWVACGINSTANTSRFFFSAALDPSVAWGASDYFDCAVGNGQKLVDLKRLGNDLVLFKEHSTHKFSYTTDPRKSELNEVDATLGVPAINCLVVYNNNTIYSLHDNAVYELFQYSYTRITTNINMEQITDLDLWAKDQYGLTLHRDRLFVRYFKNLYVYSLKVKRWSLWSSTRKFSKVVVIPSASVGLDQAYAMSASQFLPNDAYTFQDTRQVDYSPSVVNNAEHFHGKITTKTYDFDVGHSYKVLFWWGINVATSGQTIGTVTVPNAGQNYTYAQIQSMYGTWNAAALAGIKWSNNDKIVVSSTIDFTLGIYARKFLKLLKKLRFRQILFTVDFDVVSNGGISDAALRLYDITVFIRQKQTVVKETS